MTMDTTKENAPENANPVSTPMEKTIGDMLVGRQFNPSNRPDVDAVKILSAEIIDLIEKHPGTGTYIGNTIKGQAIREVASACMWAVKHLTNPH